MRTELKFLGAHKSAFRSQEAGFILICSFPPPSSPRPLLGPAAWGMAEHPLGSLWQIPPGSAPQCVVPPPGGGVLILLVFEDLRSSKELYLPSESRQEIALKG